VVDGLIAWLPIWSDAHRRIDILVPAMTTTGPASFLVRPRFDMAMSS